VTATIYLLRHAAHDDVGCYLAGKTPGTSLGSDGLRQAKRLGERMAREPLVSIFSSPQERAQQTAAALAAARGRLPVETVEALDEIDFGCWSGSTFHELNALRSMAETPAGETMLDVQRRAFGFIRTIPRDIGDTRVALVSHADVIRSIVGHVLGLPIDAWQRFEVAPASITTIALGDWGSKLLTLNEITP
jgi:broad specificity phosphatase PhoE